MRRLLLAASFLAAPVLQAQTFGALQQDARPFAPATEAQSMGGAVAAVPFAETAFFYNPAHLARRPLLRPRVTVAGVGVGLSADVSEKLRFWRDELKPAIEEGLDDIRRDDPERLDALYSEALRLGRQQSVTQAVGYGPAVQLRIGQVAAGAGLFGHGVGRLQFADAGVGIPYLDLYSQLDLIAPVAAAVEVPNSPVAVGVMTSLTRRYIMAKGALVEELNATDEHLYVLSGTALSLDLGVHARDVGREGLDLGAALHGLLGGDFTYRYNRRFDVTGGERPDDEAEIAALEARFNAREARPSLRLGAAYRIQTPALPEVMLNGITVAADYVSASSSEYAQTVGGHLRFGASVELGRSLSVRTGFSQGYPAAGATLSLPGVKLDYAFFGIEDGRAPGQLGRYNHVVQARFGLF